VVAGVVDRRTGKFYAGHNHADLPKNLHPILEARVRAVQADPYHPSLAGSHAEIYALNDALNARVANGIPVTEADLGEFTMLSTWSRGSGKGNMQLGDAAPRCDNCRRITDGTRNLAGDAAPWGRPTDDDPNWQGPG